MRRRRYIAALLIVIGSTGAGAATASDADSTPPVVEPAVSGTAGSNGWYTSDVTVGWNVADPESGLQSTLGCDPLTLTAETPATVVTCTATNNEGLAAETSVTVRIDKSSPSVTGVTGSRPSLRGWYTNPVTFTFAGSDAVSGIAACSSITYSGPDTKGASVAGSCSDNAGLSSSGSHEFKYDGSAPAIGAAIEGPAGANGWYTGAVAVTWTVVDPHSGVAGSSGCASTTVNTETGGTTLTCSASNGAGLTAEASAVVRIDTTPPETTLVSGPSGTVATRDASFAFSAEPGASFECALDGGAFAGCSSPQNYGALAEGDHTFAVRAIDAAGHTDGTPATRAWRVQAAGPVLALPADRHVEATGPSGSKVSFEVSATFAGAPLLPSAIACTPLSGSVFPIGTTSVTCRATSPLGVASEGRFSIAVTDTTPPVLIAPPPLVLNGPEAGLPATDARVRSFLASATAADLVDASPTIATNAPPHFPYGSTSVTFTARDAAGNEASTVSTLEVVRGAAGTSSPPSASAGTAPLGARPDRTPPANVRVASARAGDGVVTLIWARPADSDFSHTEVYRSLAAPGSPRTLIYRGSGTTVVDRDVTNGVEYHYLLVSFDRSGNRPPGVVVVVTPKASLLQAPPDGATRVTPPLLRWSPAEGATYYNVQLHRRGVKVLSVWPVASSLRLKRRWVYAGRRWQLNPGVYRWYVWPAYGKRAEKRYGPMLGSASFTIARR